MLANGNFPPMPWSDALHFSAGLGQFPYPLFGNAQSYMTVTSTNDGDGF